MIMNTTKTIDSDTSSNTSSDTDSNVSSNDIASSKGPYKYLKKWYDDGSDLDVLEYKFNKRTTRKSKASKLRPLKSKDVQTPAHGFALRVPIVGSVADHDMKGKRNVDMKGDISVIPSPN
ncbi:hypothetical protein Tco_0469642 [Tanacetum coccineum]